MAYYEFYNLPPDVVSGTSSAKEKTTTESKRWVQPRNPYSESGGRADDLKITYGLVASTDEIGWIGSAPSVVTCSISRRIRSHMNDVGRIPESAKTSKTGESIKFGGEDFVIEVGDLLLYKIALMSMTASWTCDPADEKKWVKCYLELDTGTGIRQKVVLERIWISSWSLDMGTEAKDIRETLTFHATRISVSKEQGDTVEMRLSE